MNKVIVKRKDKMFLMGKTYKPTQARLRYSSTVTVHNMRKYRM